MTTTISFKAKSELKSLLLTLADSKGINLSALIKLLLTQRLQQELNREVKDGKTVSEMLKLFRENPKKYAEKPLSIEALMMNL